MTRLDVPQPCLVCNYFRVLIRHLSGMSSLQAAALPDPQLPCTLGGVTQPWFPQNLVTPYVAATPLGRLVNCIIRSTITVA